MVPLPTLEVGRKYTKREISAFIARQTKGHITSDDFDCAFSEFPHLIDESDECDIYNTNYGERIVEYQELPISTFGVWLSNPPPLILTADEQIKVDDIVKLLEDGGTAFPVYLEKHQFDSAVIRIREGNHRLLAFHRMKMSQVPVFLMTRLPELLG